MTRPDVIDKLRELGLPETDCWLVAGGAMVLHGLRAETHDLDLGCTRALADRLEAEGHLYQRTSDGKRWFRLGDEIEVFEDWLCGRVERVDGIPVVSPEGLLRMKEALGREKDRADIAALRAFLRAREGR